MTAPSFGGIITSPGSQRGIPIFSNVPGFAFRRLCARITLFALPANRRGLAGVARRGDPPGFLIAKKVSPTRDPLPQIITAR